MFSPQFTGRVPHYPRGFAPGDGGGVRLLAEDILRQINVGRRNRAFEAPAVIEAFTDLERQLASPGGDTRTSEPVRRVPPRRLPLQSSTSGS